MSLPSKETGEKPSLADLFDLPADAPASVWSEPEDLQYARAPSVRSAAPAHDAAASDAGDAAENATAAGAPRIRPLSWLWIALGVLAAVSIVILTVNFSFRDAPATTDESAGIPDVPTAAATTDEPAVAPTVTLRAPAVPTDHSALVAARANLRAAEADLAAGRRTGARARLGRLLLAIDAVDPREREEIHAAAALLVARSLQADADAARGSRSDAGGSQRASR